MTVRAKFYCNSVEDFTPKAAGVAAGVRVYRFAAQYDDTIPEDQRYAKYTPSGELRIQVDNPSVEFVPGRGYYLDFTPVEDTPKEG